MKNHEGNRVLSRMGCRELSKQEVEQVQGAVLSTAGVCTFNDITRTADGECTPG
ncbi:MAG: hypothetical protein LAP21_11655 [Acidobacteriia bacterium]|nr:hypothetical protein [Terriglobia bacterium]